GEGAASEAPTPIHPSSFILHPSKVLLTAGASAPEDLVAEVCRTLVARFNATIEQRDVFEEDVYFAHPAGLRRQLQASCIDPPTGLTHVGKPGLPREVYGPGPLAGRGQAWG